jgi:hypothetical protein
MRGRGDSRLKRIRSIATKGIGVEIQQEVVVVSTQFVEAVLRSSAEYVSALLRWVRKRYQIQ